MNNLSVKFQINMKVLCDIIITAVEGGSNYWYQFNEEATEQIRKYKGKYDPKLHGDSSTYFYGTFSEAILKAIIEGEVIPVHDYEGEPDDEIIGQLSLSDLEHGIKKMAEDKRQELKILLSDDADYDADDADVIFQYIALGGLVYG